MTLILSVQGRKGGITKSTVTTTLAHAIALAGLKVLVIDSDGQGNATEAMGLERRGDFFDLITADGEFADVIRPVPASFCGRPLHLHLLSADDSQRLVENDKRTTGLMYERFRELRGVYDVVIGDTSPAATEVHTGWYYAGDYVLLPSLCELDSVNSLDRTLEFLAHASDLGRPVDLPAARILGILPNRYSAGVKNSQYCLGLLAGRFRNYPVFEHVRDNAAWGAARRQNRSIYSLVTGADRRLAMAAKEARREFQSVVESVLALVGTEAKEKAG